MARRGEGCERLRDRVDNKLAELRVRLAWISRAYVVGGVC